MTVRLKLILGLLLGLLVLLGAAAGLLLGPPPAPVVRMPDGRRLRFEGATFGENHQVFLGPWWQRLAGSFSPRLREAQPVAYVAPERDALGCWLLPEKRPPGAGPVLSLEDKVLGYLVDQHGCAFYPDPTPQATLEIGRFTQDMPLLIAPYPKGQALRLMLHGRTDGAPLARLQLQTPPSRRASSWGLGSGERLNGSLAGRPLILEEVQYVPRLAEVLRQLPPGGLGAAERGGAAERWWDHWVSSPDVGGWVLLRGRVTGPGPWEEWLLREVVTEDQGGTVSTQRYPHSVAWFPGKDGTFVAALPNPLCRKVPLWRIRLGFTRKEGMSGPATSSQMRVHLPQWLETDPTGYAELTCRHCEAKYRVSAAAPQGSIATGNPQGSRTQVLDWLVRIRLTLPPSSRSHADPRHHLAWEVEDRSGRRWVPAAPRAGSLYSVPEDLATEWMGTPAGRQPPRWLGLRAYHLEDVELRVRPPQP